MRTTHPVQIQKVSPSPPFLERRPLAGRRAARPPRRDGPLIPAASGRDGSVAMAGASGTTDPWVENGEEEVHAEVHENERYGRHQGHALDYQVVARVDGVHELEPDAGELPQDLDHEGSCEQGPDADARPGQQRERRWSHDVAQKDVARRQSL